MIALTVAVGFAALRRPSNVNFEASGPPVSLPTQGRLLAVNEEEFEGMLVGQLGRPVIVNVWASWCAPCRTEMPLLQRAAETYADRVVILGVASNDSPEAAQEFLDDFGLTYPNVFDVSSEIRTELAVTAYPTTYVFGADGRLQVTIAGGISEQRLAAVIENALR
ncbi:MAG: TlpA disulfide reductase family protein [Microthrixaceae bacterium]